MANAWIKHLVDVLQECFMYELMLDNGRGRGGGGGGVGGRGGIEFLVYFYDRNWECLYL